MAEIRIGPVEVGRRLQAARMLRGRTDQVRFAKEMRDAYGKRGISVKMYGDLERGDTTAPPQLFALKLIASHLELPLEFFTKSEDDLFRVVAPADDPIIVEIQRELAALKRAIGRDVTEDDPAEERKPVLNAAGQDDEAEPSGRSLKRRAKGKREAT